MLVPRPRIFVADDDDDVRMLVASALRLDGYEVVEARDGRAVLDAMGDGDRQPDAIVTDVCMPVVDGLALLRKLREGGWNTPVVVMTAYGSAMRDQAEGLGADATLAKPFDVDELRALVTNALHANDVTINSKGM